MGEVKWPSFRSKSVFFNAVGYRPTEAQRPIHESDARHLLIGGGERAGKSRATAMEAFSCFPQWSLLYIVGNDYDACLPEFDYLRDYFHLLSEVTGSKLVIREKRPASGQARSSLDLKIGQDVKKIITISTQRKGGQAVSRKGEAPDMVLCVEFETLPYDVYLAARGRVAEKRGRVILSGTFPDDSGWSSQMWRRWLGENDEDGKSFSIPIWSNLKIFPGGLENSEIKSMRAVFTDAEWMRRFGAEPQAPSTLVFGEFSYADHVRDWVEYDPKLPVELALDPGYGESSYAVLAMQEAGPFAFAIDEIYVRGMIGEEVVAEAKKREWWDSVPKASRHATGGVIDVAGRQHHAAPSQIEVWRNEGDVALRSQKIAPKVGRERIKSFLMAHPETGIPRVLFSTKCKHTAEEFTRYCWKKRPEERFAGDEPLNRDCDAIKALGYWLVDRYGIIEYPSLPVVDITPREELWRRAFKMSSK